MSTTSLQFGPEWMRNKQATTPSANRPPPSVLTGMPGTSPGASSYSSLLTVAPSVPEEKQDVVNPFKYSKEEMLQVWKVGGGRGALGLEVELWEGVVKESGGEPIGLKEMSDAEKKLFSHSINSDLRRRQSHDFLPGSAERSKLSHSASSTHGSLGQSRYGALLARKRKEDGSDTGPPLSVPRRLSLTSLASPLGVPLSPTGGGLPSPRTRLGNGPHGFDSPVAAGDGSWRKRDPDPVRIGDTLTEECDEQAGAERDSSGVDPNGSFNGSDLSHSISARSMAPSPPSFRDDSGGGAPLEDLSAPMSVLSMLDEENRPDSIPNGLNDDTLGTNTYKSGISAARPPGMEDDPSNVSWSYRDPKGNIQGPFAATLMQKWYDEGYFTPDLLMKRTHLDTDWTPVGELSLRASNAKLFFSSFADRGPPGLTPLSTGQSLSSQAFDRVGQPSLQNVPIQPMHQGQETFANGAAFRHPAGVPSRTTAFDAYLGSSSNTSQSPILSNFSANTMGGVSAASPDIALGRSVYTPDGMDVAFGGRVGNFDQQSGLGPRTSFVTPTESPFGPRLTILGQRGSTFEGQGSGNVSISPWGTHSSSNLQRPYEYDILSNTSLQRTTLNNVYGSLAIPNGSNQDSVGLVPEVYGITNTGFSQMTRDGEPSVFGTIGPGAGLDDSVQHGFDEHPHMQAGFGSGYGPTTSSTSTPPNNQGLPQPLASQHLPQQLPGHFQTNTASGAPAHSVTIQQVATQASSQISNGPWGTSQTAQPRPRPFDAPHPTAYNVVTTPSGDDAVAAISKLQIRPEPTEWYNSSKTEGEVAVTESLQTAPSELSHEQQTAWNTPPRLSPALAEPVPPQATQTTIPIVAPQPVQQPVPAKRRQSAIQSAAVKPVAVLPTQSMAIHTIPSPMLSAPAPVKPAWGTSISPDEEKTTKTGLREIQEVEAKRAEVKKQAEREKERAARTVSQEETQTFTASWGLPTSQAGMARSVPKEQAPIVPPPQPIVTVWTNAVKPTQAKRTMKEIQEEEERRKKAAAKEKETATIVARRAYADSAHKVVSNQSSGGVWSTVGAGGKVTTAATASRQISSSTPIVSQASARPINGSTSTRPGTSSSVASSPATKSVSASSKPAASPVEEGPVPPSPEFMKWLREAVRGFNVGFNTEEFITMLLTFSLDFPPSTVEVIQEMVYMNSTTLDGRRFAADFCSRRKADAANRPKLAVTGKQPSLADIVKTQPKPAQSELPFKMVKKKGRGNALR